MAGARSVAIVSAVVPHPPDSGKRVVLRGLVDYWVDRVGADSVHYVLVGGAYDDDPPLRCHVHRVSAPRATEQMASLCWRTVVRRRHSIQESMLYAPRVGRELDALLGHIGADVEVFDTIRMAQYAETSAAGPGTSRVVYLDDLYSVRYHRMLQVLKQSAGVRVDPLGEFRGHVPGVLRPLTAARLSQRLLLGYERSLVARREVEVTRRFGGSLLVNHDEAELLGSAVPGTYVGSLPPTVASGRPAPPRDGHPEFLLLGLLSLPHNHDAAQHFLEVAMPQVVRLMPEARVRIVGRGASPGLLRQAARFGGRVVVDGYVPDLDDVLGRATAVLAPLRFGSGVKIKVITALAHGVPVIATGVGAEGVAHGPHRGVLVEDDVLRHPQLMVGLAEPGRRAELSASALRHHRQTYAPEAAFAAYDRLFEVLTA